MDLLPCPFCASTALKTVQQSDCEAVVCSACPAMASTVSWQKREFDYSEWATQRIAYLTRRVLELSTELYELKIKGVDGM